LKLIASSFGVPADPKLDYDSRAQFYYAYSSLVLYSFGLENALEVSQLSTILERKADPWQRAKMDISFFLLNVYEAATVSQLSLSGTPGISADL